MSYSMYLSVLYDKSMDELEALKKKHEDSKAKAENILKESKVRELTEKVTDDSRSIKEIESVIEDKKFDELKRTLTVTDEHRKLLAAMEFEHYKDGGDYVFMGVNGKRPFGNSSIYSDIAQTLSWKLPNDDLSDEQYERAKQLIVELPIALNKILREATNSAGQEEHARD